MQTKKKRQQCKLILLITVVFVFLAAGLTVLGYFVFKSPSKGPAPATQNPPPTASGSPTVIQIPPGQTHGGPPPAYVPPQGTPAQAAPYPGRLSGQPHNVPYPGRLWWTCNLCSTRNAPTATHCSVCQNMKGASVNAAPGQAQPHNAPGNPTMQALLASRWTAPVGHAYADSHWRQGQFHNIRTRQGQVLPNACWAASFLQELGQTPISARIEALRVPDNGDGYFYSDLRARRQFAGETTAHAGDYIRAQRTRLLLKLVTDYVQGVAKCNIGMVVRSIVTLIANNSQGQVVVGRQNDSGEGLNMFVQWLRFSDTTCLRMVDVNTCGSPMAGLPGCGRTSENTAPETQMRFRFPLPLPGAVAPPAMPFLQIVRGFFNPTQVQKICESATCSGNNRGHITYYHYERILPGSFVNMQLHRFAPQGNGQYIKDTTRVQDIPLRFQVTFNRGADITTMVLRSFVVHDGQTMNMGHYVSYALTSGGWMCFNDMQQIPQPVTPQQVAQHLPNAYLMVWEVESSTPNPGVANPNQLLYSVPGANSA